MKNTKILTLSKCASTIYIYVKNGNAAHSRYAHQQKKYYIPLLATRTRVHLLASTPLFCLVNIVRECACSTEICAVIVPKMCLFRSHNVLLYTIHLIRLSCRLSAL